MNPNVNYGLWVIMMCQCRSITCNKCITLMGNVNNGGGYARVETGDNGKYLYFLFNFAVNPKLL